tara:strand:- start:1688 stop:2272 length:585 start_codon:yes stop_codon:yes gene_type:complete
LTVLVTGCSEENSNLLDDTRNQSKVEEVLILENLNEQKLAYSLLSPKEKHQLWNLKIDHVIESWSLNKKQIELLKELKVTSKVTQFVADSDDQVYFQTIFVPTYLRKLKTEFSNKEIGNIFYTASRKYYLTHEEDNDGGGGSSKDCDCNRNSTSSCLWLNTDSCEERAEVNGCKVVTTGCGFFWAYSCNGKCNA